MCRIFLALLLRSKVVVAARVDLLAQPSQERLPVSLRERGLLVDVEVAGLVEAAHAQTHSK